VDSLLRMDQVKTRTGLSRSSIYAKVSTGEFPKPIALSSRSVAWIEAEIAAWIQARIANSRKPGA
jgi:prophage regulatory protein